MRQRKCVNLKKNYNFCRFLSPQEFDKNYDEWAVLYHGTFQENAHLIMQTGVNVTILNIPIRIVCVSVLKHCGSPVLNGLSLIHI